MEGFCKQLAFDDAFEYPHGVSTALKFQLYRLTELRLSMQSLLGKSLQNVIEKIDLRVLKVRGVAYTALTPPSIGRDTSSQDVSAEQKIWSCLKPLQQLVLELAHSESFEEGDTVWKPTVKPFSSDDPRVGTMHDTAWKALAQTTRSHASNRPGLHLAADASLSTQARVVKNLPSILLFVKAADCSWTAVPVSRTIASVDNIRARRIQEGAPLIHHAAVSDNTSTQWRISICVSTILPNEDTRKSLRVNVNVPVRLGGLGLRGSVDDAKGVESNFLRDGNLYTYTARLDPDMPRAVWYEEAAPLDRACLASLKDQGHEADVGRNPHAFAFHSGFFLRIAFSTSGDRLAQVFAAPPRQRPFAATAVKVPPDPGYTFKINGEVLCEDVQQSIHAALLVHQEFPLCSRLGVDGSVRTFERVVAETTASVVHRSVREILCNPDGCGDSVEYCFWKVCHKIDLEQFKMSSSEVGTHGSSMEIDFPRGDRRPESVRAGWFFASIPTLVDGDEKRIGVAAFPWAGTSFAKSAAADYRTGISAVLLINPKGIRPIDTVYWKLANCGHDYDVVGASIAGIVAGSGGEPKIPKAELAQDTAAVSSEHIVLCCGGVPFAAFFDSTQGRNNLEQLLLDQGIALQKDGATWYTSCEEETQLRLLLRKLFGAGVSAGAGSDASVILYNGRFIRRVPKHFQVVADTLRRCRGSECLQQYVSPAVSILETNGVVLLDSQPTALVAEVQNSVPLRALEAQFRRVEPSNARLPYGEGLAVDRLQMLPAQRRMNYHKFQTKGEQMLLPREPLPALLQPGISHFCLRRDAATICCKEVNGEDAVFVSRALLARSWSLYAVQARIHREGALQRRVSKGERIGRKESGEPVYAPIDMALLDFSCHKTQTLVLYAGVRTLGTGDKLTMEVQKFVISGASPASLGVLAMVESGESRRVVDMIVDTSSVVNRKSRLLLESWVQTGATNKSVADTLARTDVRDALVSTNFRGYQANKPPFAKGIAECRKPLQGDVFATNVMEGVAPYPVDRVAGKVCGSCGKIAGCKQTTPSNRCDCSGDFKTLFGDSSFVNGVVATAAMRGCDAHLSFQKGASMDSPFGRVQLFPPVPSPMERENSVATAELRDSILWVKTKHGSCDLLEILLNVRTQPAIVSVFKNTVEDPRVAREHFRETGRCAQKDDIIAAQLLILASPILPSHASVGSYFSLHVPLTSNSDLRFRFAQIEYMEELLKDAHPSDIIFNVGLLPVSKPDVFDERWIAHREGWDFGLHLLKDVRQQSVEDVLAACGKRGWNVLLTKGSGEV